MIRNIKKRKELAQMVYDKYTPPITKEVKDCLEGEVYAAFDGYEKALGNIIQIIVDSNNDHECVNTIRNFIVAQLNNKGTKNPFRFSEWPTTQMRNYINSTVKDELVRKGESKEDAALICKAFIDHPSARESIIDKNNLDSIRVCKHCGKPMCEGYLKDDFETYCSEECVKEYCNLSDDEFENLVSYADEDDAPLYWTVWEC